MSRVGEVESVRSDPATASFERQPPPYLARCTLGVLLYGIGAPLVWTMERLGRADRLFAKAGARRERMLAAGSPFSGYTPSEHDVFIATYAKSGTNWMMQIVHQLLNHGRAQFEHIHCVVPWPDTKSIPPLRGYAIPLEDPAIWMASPERKRVIKTHLSWEMLPYSEKARYIIVIRDPKDVFVSNYFFLKSGIFGPAMPSVETWLRLYLSNDFVLGGSWAVTNAAYWSQRHRQNVLILSFKSMKRDLAAAVRKVAAFLDVRMSDDLMERVSEMASFAYMKRIDHKFSMWKTVPWRRQSSMLRRGVQGGASELLSPEQMRQIDAYCIEELKRLGSDLPYTEFCDFAP